MIVAPNLMRPLVKEVTGKDDFTIGHPTTTLSVIGGFVAGLVGDKLIYGAEAFFNTMAFYLYFGFVFVFMWIAWVVLTFAFTVFTVIYVRRKK